MTGEICEGEILDLDKILEIKVLIEKHFPEGTLYGIISNRINSYSTDFTHGSEISSVLKNTVAYATITYSENAKTILGLEKVLLKLNRADFNCLETASNWIINEMKDNFQNS